MVHLPDGYTDFNIVVGVLQGDTLAPYMSIIYLDYVLQMSIDIKENGFKYPAPQKTKNRRYPVEAKTDADYADDLKRYSQIYLPKLNPLCIAQSK